MRATHPVMGIGWNVAGTPTGLVLALLAEFASDMREAKTINQLALSSGKAYANVHAVATQLLAENILLKETVGHSHRCRLNLSNDKTLLYLSLLQTVKRDDLLRTEESARATLRAIDDHGPMLGVLLAWHCDGSLLLVTSNPHPTHEDVPPLPTPTTIMPLSEFLKDTELQATLGRHTLLFGHALYASLLAEQNKSSSRMEVRR